MLRSEHVRTNTRFSLYFFLRKLFCTGSLVFSSFPFVHAHTHPHMHPAPSHIHMCACSYSFCVSFSFPSTLLLLFPGALIFRLPRFPISVLPSRGGVGVDAVGRAWPREDQVSSRDRGHAARTMASFRGEGKNHGLVHLFNHPY